MLNESTSQITKWEKSKMIWTIKRKRYFAKLSFNYIITGFFFHLLGQVMVAITGNQVLQAFVCLIGWYFICKGIIKIKRFGFKLPFTGFYQCLFIAYLLICIVMIIRGYLIDYNYQWISWQGMINFHLFSPVYILPYLMPLIVFIPIECYDFRSFIKYSVIISYISIIIIVVFFQEINRSSALQAIGLGGEYGFGSRFAQIYIPFAFAVLCRKYISNKIWMINSIGLLLALLIFAIAARRGSVATTACLFLFNLYFYIKSMRKRERWIATILSIAIIFGLSLYFVSSDNFNFIKKRGMEDTRSGVDKALLNQMSDSELIFGKGLNGRYYYPLYANDYLKGWRYGSETGFYNIVLKGGYLMAIIYIILLAYPAILGIFKSKNMLCKALGFYLILSLIKLYPFGWLMFNMEFVVIWMGVALCYHKTVRKLSDHQIYLLFFRDKICTKKLI